MKSVGILTVHQSVNCGASLQAAALYRTVSDLGYYPEIINYRPKYFVDYTDALYSPERKTIKGIVKMLMIGDRLKKSANAFASYGSKYYPNMTERYSSLEELRNGEFRQYSAWICGSDQIWNPSHVKYDQSWVFDFLQNDESGKKISYAASIGKDVLSEFDLEWLKVGVSKFDAVGVREDTGVSILGKMGISAAQCLDPTLLRNPEEWRKQKRRPECQLPSEYIFYYPIEENSIESELLLALKAKTGLPCVALTNSFKKPKYADYQIVGYGPEEFLYLMDQSTVVFTNSFHGLAFSILFGKALVSYKNETKNSRLASLFRLIGLENYQIESADDIKKRDLGLDADRMNTAFEAILRERPRSIGFLQNALE